jgi:uncharacterized protein
MGTFLPTARTTVRRKPTRGVYDREQVFKILDEALICHVGFNDEDGRPVVIPTGYGRAGERLYLHGSAASRMMRSLTGGIPVCVEVTLLDGMVLARSAFHHSMNYRSVMIFGTAKLVTEEAEKNEGLRVITEHLVPGRWNDVRLPTSQELKGTTVLSLDLEEVSAKVRTGGPIDDDEDMDYPVWAGVVPVRLVADAPVVDDKMRVAMQPPDYATNYKR